MVHDWIKIIGLINYPGLLQSWILLQCIYCLICRMLLLQAASGARRKGLCVAVRAAGTEDIAEHHDTAGGEPNRLHQPGSAHLRDGDCTG